MYDNWEQDEINPPPCPLCDLLEVIAFITAAGILAAVFFFLKWIVGA